MNIEFRLTLKDYQEASQAHIKSQHLLYFFNWSASILFLLLGVVMLFSKDILFSVFLVVIGICSNPSFNPLQNYFIARLWKSQPSIREPMTLEISEEGLTGSSPIFQSTVKWQIYTHFIETTNLFVVYQSKRLFNMFPKRAFSNEQELDEFRYLLERKIVKSP